MYWEKVKDFVSLLFDLFFGSTRRLGRLPAGEEEWGPPEVQPPPKKNPDEVPFVWSLVGNIVWDHPYGEEKEIRRGTKHFSPGAKVYCFPVQWGDGYRKIKVIGRPRGTTRYIFVVISSARVTNWRLDKVYAPHVKRLMLENRGWDDSEKSRQEIEEMALALNKIEDP